ncbi:MAG: PQQ-dependent sugar dehydrogenase [Desulfobulbaceae bacterium]|nr:PQQ-dependent sugar dehydrogenase [Desulfobulbaceae bacterium]
MKAIFILIKLCLLCVISSGPALGGSGKILLTAHSDGMAFQVEKITESLGVPWGMAFLSPSEIIVTERHGSIRLLDPENGKTRNISGAPEVMASGQGGLLDVAVPPGYRADGWIYFTYSKRRKGRGVTTLARAHRRGNTLVDWQDLLITKSATDTGRHFGSRIAFDNEGHLFFTVGERGYRPNAQDLSTHAGSVLRVNFDGSVPPDNPFIERTNSLPEIWSYGHRNPQGIVYDEENKRLWVIEHGPRGGDEINLIRAGRNYGWPVISYGKEYWGPVQVGEGTEKKGMEQPVKVYIPSIAPGSLLLYSGKAFAGWKGNLFAGALKGRHLNRIKLDQNGRAVDEERLLGNLHERIRALIESPEGWIYLSTDTGRILRIKPIGADK